MGAFAATLLRGRIDHSIRDLDETLRLQGAAAT
jgi:hypothetical protein